MYISQPEEGIGLNIFDINDLKFKPNYEYIIPISIILKAIENVVQILSRCKIQNALFVGKVKLNIFIYILIILKKYIAVKIIRVCIYWAPI
ncbi:hypothetical protein PVSEL_1400150 [Plasmodium vinckei]|uniref:Uncharacterized protein n=1 Tax=Plasmodium vinckei TaxID=5860 RepID=A0A6V7TD25_PLAVN|nr:hypothetical protein PVSEL_1400150 [Plasmodium vinckei]